MAFENFLTPEQQEWRDVCYAFMDREITREYVRECDKAREYYEAGWRKIVAAGWHALLLPESIGGGGAGAMEYAIMCEAGSRYSPDFVVATIGIPVFTSGTVAKFATAAQIDQYLKPFIAGDRRFAIGISEPGAGSDAAATATKAVRDGDHYVINGAKQWISAAGVDDVCIVLLVRTSTEHKHRGLSTILVPKGTPGVEFRKIDTLARRATGTCQVFFDDARVPVENLLGAEGQGWEVVGANLELERISCAAEYVGCAQQAIDDALLYATQREQFGRPIFDFQTIKHRLASMQTEVDAARLMTYRAAATVDAGQDALREVSMAKLFASEVFQKVTRDGVQIMGGAGMLPDQDMERYFREGMQATIGGGTSEIQRSVIAKTMRGTLP